MIRYEARVYGQKEIIVCSEEGHCERAGGWVVGKQVQEMNDLNCTDEENLAIVSLKNYGCFSDMILV